MNEKDMQPLMDDRTHRPADLLVPKRERKILYLVLFLLTLATTTLSGMLWRMETDLTNFSVGLPYAFLLLFILSAHEFGHYFAARYYGVKTTLPYYIPVFLPGFINFGTFGAVIRMKQYPTSRKALFDIGIAGPLAGYVASLAVLIYGFSNLPGPEYILHLHPGFDLATGTIPGETGMPVVTFGSSLMYSFLSHVVPSQSAWVPPMTEMYHYPFLIAGWFGLLVTAMNLIPAGQLDGGHILYAMVGPKHGRISRIVTALLIVFGSLAFLPMLLEILFFPEWAKALYAFIPAWDSIFSATWLLFGLLILFMIKLDHPPIPDVEPLSPGRVYLGWLSLFIFVVSFTPAPIYLGGVPLP